MQPDCELWMYRWSRASRRATEDRSLEFQGFSRRDGNGELLAGAATRQMSLLNADALLENAWLISEATDLIAAVAPREISATTSAYSTRSCPSLRVTSFQIAFQNFTDPSCVEIPAPREIP